ncbi:MAG TPA: ribonuclease, partial [Erythrobacter sp.]|nr:ribonuclease [Erythrobacter sp.]
MPDWLVEHGIGESRALLVEGDDILAARLRWPGNLPVGSRAQAVLVSKPAGRSRGLARMANGTELMVDRIPAHCNEGAAVPLVVTRAAIAERGRFKRAQARVVEDTDNSPSQQADDVFAMGDTVRRLPAGAWEEVWHTASAGEVAFAGGALLFSVTPAMTL